jgi:hypothetical protein
MWRREAGLFGEVECGFLCKVAPRNLTRVRSQRMLIRRGSVCGRMVWV